MGSYLSFLSYLINLGPAVAQALPLLFAAIDLFQQGVGKLGEFGKLIGLPSASPAVNAPVAMAAFEVSVDEAALETQLVTMAKSHGVTASGFGDGRILTGIRTGWQWLQKHPEIAKLIFAGIGLPSM